MSLESFGDTDTTARATQMTLEGIGETIKKIWQAIKNAVMRVINSVREFFAKIFTRTKGLKAELDAYSQVLRWCDDKFGKGEFKVPGIASRIHAAGKVDGASVAKTFGVMATAGNAFFNDYVDSAKAYYKST